MVKIIIPKLGYDPETDLEPGQYVKEEVSVDGDSSAWSADSKVHGRAFFMGNATLHDATRRGQLQQLLLKFFSSAQVLNEVPKLKQFQEHLRLNFDPHDPQKSTFGGTLVAWKTVNAPTVGLALNRYLGAVIEGTDLNDPPTVTNPTTLGHAQFVIFWHLLYAQEDVQLLSPFNLDNTLLW